MTFFKAVRLDGADFHSGKILYEVGKRVRPYPSIEPRKICGPGYLHASTEPAETLVGGRWPCRLFEVAGKSQISRGHKHGFHQLTVIRELDAYLALGPNGREVAVLIERCKTLTATEAQGLGAATHAATHAARDAARDAARIAARIAARAAARAAAGLTAWNAVATYVVWDVVWDVVCDVAGDAAADAAAALVAKDLISKEHFDVLYGPWAQVIG